MSQNTPQDVTFAGMVSALDEVSLLAREEVIRNTL
jgi:hypothetical protein